MFLLKKLGGGNSPQNQKVPMCSDSVASHIVTTISAPIDKAHPKRLKDHLKTLKSEKIGTEHFCPCPGEEISAALTDITPGKASGYHRIYSEFLLNCEKYEKIELGRFFTNIIQTTEVPREFKRLNVIAIQKPG